VQAVLAVRRFGPLLRIVHRTRAHCHRRFARREEVRESSIRVYTCRELIDILKQADMSNFNCLGKDGEQFRIGSQRLWLEAEKRA
jgi:hypothetical protein